MSATSNWIWNIDTGATCSAGTGYTYNTSSNWYSFSLDNRGRVDAKAPLGSGKISKLAQKADDLELEPNCTCDEKQAWMTVKSYDNKKLRKLAKYAKRIGFVEVDYLLVGGEECPCYL